MPAFDEWSRFPLTGSPAGAAREGADGASRPLEPILARPIAADTIVARPRASARARTRRRVRLLSVSIGAGLALLLALTLLFELRTSTVQARVFSTQARRLSYALAPGAGPVLRSPEGGPYDERLGYSRLPAFVERLRAAGYAVEAQARPSPAMLALGRWGLFPIYHEKDRAGLRVTDRADRPLYEVRVPERVYERFERIPEPILRTLLFVENRDLLDPQRRHLNPAIDWHRLTKAVGLELLGKVGRQGQTIGASTLATQIEKFRHSPEGRTRSAGAKLRQMISASLRAYQDGADSWGSRQMIVKDYINSMPLGAAIGRGEVLGLGEGLWAWYGMDFGEANRLLTDGAAPWEGARARAYKRVVSLILAARRPYYYLTENRPALEAFTDSYLRVMARAGAIDAGLRDAALGQALDFRAADPAPSVDYSERKGANLVRARLTTLLGVPALYDLDRLDLEARSTLDGPSQEAVSQLLQSLRRPETVRALGLRGFHLLERGDPARVLYSFTLYERGEHANLLRVQTDSLDQPLDLNAGARLDLGSTAKLRTLITYLETIDELYARYRGLGVVERRGPPIHPKDRLTAWAIDYLDHTPRASRTAMLEAALERRYSASPAEAFVTGGGLQSFHNFNPDDDARVLSVREGFRKSVNLVFIRLMRDIVDHHLYERPASLARVLEDPDDPRRQAYLTRFADREGSEFIRRFYKKYQGKPPDQALDLALAGARQTPRALCAVLRSVDPDAGLDHFKRTLTARLPAEALPERVVEAVYDTQDPRKLSLVDRGYIARVHPLELWLVAYLRRNPHTDLAGILEASAGQRQAVYGWLFKTQRRHAQDKRIRSLLEVQAFLEIQRGWQHLGYPFASVTPSLASAIGSSGDRPAALAKLMGIIVNEGLSYPTVLARQLDFAADTPYQVRLTPSEGTGERVMAAEVAGAARRALLEVVEQGTAQSLRESLSALPGATHVIGGKTGTGDHRYETFAPGGRLVASRPVERAATFVFSIDDRFFGTVTAYVAGREAARYEFTSALPVRLLAILMPTLAPLIGSEGPPLPSPSEGVDRRSAGVATR
jgi:membrane peptidoglycan carboxypeptidase